MLVFISQMVTLLQQSRIYSLTAMMEVTKKKIRSFSSTNMHYAFAV
uniref:Uncharacterized protein n=1 Tax=Amphimedon queenslandica TaxID=400682 RepID=A0A1X7SMR9_AMPQE